MKNNNLTLYINLPHPQGTTTAVVISSYLKWKSSGNTEFKNSRLGLIEIHVLENETSLMPLAPPYISFQMFEPNSLQGPENVKLTTLHVYRSTVRPFTAFTWHNDSCCDFYKIGKTFGSRVEKTNRLGLTESIHERYSKIQYPSYPLAPA